MPSITLLPTTGYSQSSKDLPWSNEVTQDEAILPEGEPLENFSAASADAMLIADEDEDYITIRVPKYFQALFTLLVCCFLLFCTLGLIHQIKHFCRKSSCSRNVPLIRVDSDKDKEDCSKTATGQLHSKNGSPRPPADGKKKDGHVDPKSGKHADSTEDPEEMLNPKRVRFVRRVSGPFGDEAIDFVGQTYKKKLREKPQAEKLGEVGKSIRNQSIRKHARSPTPSTPQPDSRKH